MVTPVSQAWLIPYSPRREPAQAGVLGVPDPVLDAGRGAVPGFKERMLPDVLLVAKAW
jgi:hypothetical protein